MKKQLIPILCFLLIPLTLLSADKPQPTAEEKANKEKAVLIEKLLDVSGNKTGRLQMIDQMVKYTGNIKQEVPAEYWGYMSEKLKKEVTFEDIVIIYDKYFTLEEIKQLIAFYESEIGKKFVEVTPHINRFVVDANKAWSQVIQNRMMTLMEQDGYHEF